MAELRRVLYGLYTPLRVHFAKEQEIYFPILDEAPSKKCCPGALRRDGARGLID